MMRDAQTKMTAARTRLLLDHPWFGSLAMRLKIEPDSTIKTFNVNGTVLKYSPTAAQELTDSELTGVMAHEVLHCALLHPYRRGNRDAKLWNMACDYAINSQVIAAGLKLPKDVLLDPQYDGLSADVIYARLSRDQQPQGNQSGQGQGNGQGDEPTTGAVSDAPADSQADSQTMAEADWTVAAEQATAVSKGCGKLPAGIDAKVKQARQVPADWRAILREFIEHTVPNDYSWMSPNRRHIANGVYLPGMTKENMGHIAIAVDTSGSIDTGLLAMFCQELNAVASEAKPSKISVIYCDSRVHRTDEFSGDEPITMDAVGRGGTAFCPVFDAVNAWEEKPACLIYFTDLDSMDHPEQPEYPTLWVTSLAVTQHGPFGETVRIAND